MEEEIKELLGESYKEGMTGTEIQAAFKSMLLSSGDYVNKDKADAEKRELENGYKSQISKLNESLTSKMTDAEKAKAAQAQRDAEFESMKKLLEETQMNANKSTALGNISKARELSGIADGDEAFSKFISNIVSKDTEKTNEVSSYINNLVKQAYEKGKIDAKKAGLGEMGKDGKGSQDNEDGELSDVENRVKKIVEAKKASNQNYYWNKN